MRSSKREAFLGGADDLGTCCSSSVRFSNGFDKYTVDDINQMLLQLVYTTSAKRVDVLFQC